MVAIHRYLEGLIAIGTAAELAGASRVAFECQFVDPGPPKFSNDGQDFVADRAGLAEAERGVRSR